MNFLFGFAPNSFVLICGSCFWAIMVSLASSVLSTLILPFRAYSSMPPALERNEMVVNS